METSGMNKTDLELQARPIDPLFNADVGSFSWEGVTVTVRDRATKLPKDLVGNVRGHLHAGTAPSLQVRPKLTN